jgi:hypothetical protein
MEGVALGLVDSTDEILSILVRAHPPRILPLASY